MRSRVPILLAALLVAALSVGAAPTAAQPPDEETRLELQLQEDGDASWTIVATVPLETEDDVENFRSFADTYEEGKLDFRLGVDAFRRAADQSASQSGREMTIRGANRSAELIENTTADGTTERYGELRVSFTWTNFARLDENDTMYVDDAFLTENGTWLSGLSPNQTLVIRSPPGYSSPTNAPTGAELSDGDLRWRGPETFERGYFRIVYEPTEEAFGLSTVLLAGALSLSAAALLLGLYLLWRRRGGESVEEPSAPPADDPTDGGADEPAAASGGSAAGEAAGAAAGTDAGGDEEDDEVDLELLSDEERVEHLLEENGGRMKQADIVKETGWSNAKVSQLLSSMADDDRIDKLRIGRENLISLPDEGVGELDADHDES